MSITGTLANALSGLTASARAAELVSSNVANAMTPGYGRREISLQPRYMGSGATAGVNVTGVRREVDEVIIQDRRLADAAVGYENTTTSFAKSVEKLLGAVDDQSSLSGHLAKLEAALIEAASRPDSSARLNTVVNEAAGIASFLNRASDEIQGMRMEADASIGAQVDQLNNGLQRVEDLNIEIREAIARGQDTSPLLDLRQQAVDSLSQILPMRQVDRGNGMIALYTTGGAIVLDATAAKFSFSPVGVIVPEMSVEGGTLSGIEINGNPIRTEGRRSPIAGGSLAASFEIRDELAVTAQARFDAVARDLIERFQASDLDTTRAPGEPGLFTDNGAEFVPANSVGVAGRIEINRLVDPASGGDLWKLRDGLGAIAPGDVGDATLLRQYHDALAQGRISSADVFGFATRSASALVADFHSLVASERLASEDTQAFATAQQDALTFMEMESGVDTDHEMQKLMLIEEAYAANARVVTAVNEMLDHLMSI